MRLKANATHSTKNADSTSTMLHTLAGQRRAPLHTVHKCHSITPKPPMKATMPKICAKRTVESNLELRLLMSLSIKVTVRPQVASAAKIRIAAILLHRYARSDLG